MVKTGLESTAGDLDIHVGDTETLFPLVGREDDLELIDHQLHYLALEHHVKRHVG